MSQIVKSAIALFPQTTKSAIALQSCQIYSILPIISSGAYTS